jgi:hypothetical protein
MSDRKVTTGPTAISREEIDARDQALRAESMRDGRKARAASPVSPVRRR